MPRASEPVRPQQRRAQIDKEARRNGKAEDQIKHDAASHPLGRTDSQAKGRKGDQAQRKIDHVQHGASPES
ncbi:hypothetical protein [Paragemmobacter ruber]